MTSHEVCQRCRVPIVGTQRLELERDGLVYAVDNPCCRLCAFDVALVVVETMQVADRYPDGTRFTWRLMRWPLAKPIVSGDMVVRVAN